MHLFILFVFLEEAIDLSDLLIAELEGQSCLDFPVELILTPEHGVSVDEVADGESD